MMLDKIIQAIKEFFVRWFKMMNPPVFFGAAGFVLAVILFGTLWTETAGRVFSQVLDFISKHFGWYYVLIVFFFLIFVIWLYFSPYGKIRLGGENSKPEFSRFGWFSMLFAAGMGMGIIFWGVAEPIMHYMEPPMSEPETVDSLREGMRFSFFHWGFHPWAIYIIFALGIAYFHFRHKLPLAPRSLLYPILGERIHGWIGHFADAFCTVGTLLGVATSLGLGAMQINSGINALTDIPFDTNTQLIIIAAITFVAIISLVSGIGRGIKFLSMTNVIIMFALMVFVFIAGPTLYQLNIFVSTLGDYMQNIVDMSLWLDIRPDSNWQSDWTLFYWGWWLSWCPFVGIFIARVSKGRTIREFVLYVLIIPTMVTFFWFSVFGGTAMHIELFGDGGLSSIVQDNVAMSLHALLEELPFASITKWVGVLLVIIFFITSSDSGSLVDDMVTSGGHPNPPIAQRIFWGTAEGAAAASLLMAGGLNALRTASIAAGLPQSILVVLTCYSLVKALHKDYKTKGVPKLGKLKEDIDQENNETSKN
ncbi:MAG: BCCT family transporter [Bacteroidales bacterium]